jgi:hypothetical protein
MYCAAKGAQVDESSAGADRRPSGSARAFTVLWIAAQRAWSDHVALTPFAVFVAGSGTWCALLLRDANRGYGLTLLVAPVVTASASLWVIRSVSGSSGGAATEVLGFLAVTFAAIADWHSAQQTNAHHVGLPTAQP